MNYSRKPRTALYLLPNIFTTAALFFGFYAILQAIDNNWQQAALGVLVAALLDACDGRVARWTHTESLFGVEYDSLSDVVSFGATPAVILYQWSLQDFGKFGLGIAFCHCAATALRLARFNCQVGNNIDRRYFIGIPSPAAALAVVSFIATCDSLYFTPPTFLVAIFSLIIAFSMISGLRFHNPASLNFKNRTPFRSGVLLLAIGAIIINALTYHVMLALLVVIFSYLISGYVFALLSFITRKKRETR